MKSSCLPTVLSASENFALNNACNVAWSLARTVPMACATFLTSSTVLLTRTKKEMRMSARMLSRQIRPSRPVRAMSMVLTEMSIVSALCRMGSTTCPVNVTSTLRTFETMSALPCSTLRNRRLTTSSRVMPTSRTTATSTPNVSAMGFMAILVIGAARVRAAALGRARGGARVLRSRTCREDTT